MEKEAEGLSISHDFNKKIANFLIFHKELIEICKNAKNLHIDTYKLMDLGNPIIVIGAYDNT